MLTPLYPSSFHFSANSPYNFMTQSSEDKSTENPNNIFEKGWELVESDLLMLNQDLLLEIDSFLTEPDKKALASVCSRMKDVIKPCLQQQPGNLPMREIPWKEFWGIFSGAIIPTACDPLFSPEVLSAIVCFLDKDSKLKLSRTSSEIRDIVAPIYEENGKKSVPIDDDKWEPYGTKTQVAWKQYLFEKKFGPIVAKVISSAIGYTGEAAFIYAINKIAEQIFSAYGMPGFEETLCLGLTAVLLGKSFVLLDDMRLLPEELNLKILTFEKREIIHSILYLVGLKSLMIKVFTNIYKVYTELDGTLFQPGSCSQSFISNSLAESKQWWESSNDAIEASKNMAFYGLHQCVTQQQLLCNSEFYRNHPFGPPFITTPAEISGFLEVFLAFFSSGFHLPLMCSIAKLRRKFQGNLESPQFKAKLGRLTHSVCEKAQEAIESCKRPSKK